MFFASGPGFRMPLELSGVGGFGDSATIEVLQRSLLALSQATNRPSINPGPNTGMVNDATMNAVASAMDLLVPELPNTVYLALHAGMMTGTHSAQAKNLVAQYAHELAMASRSAATKYRMNPQAYQMPSMQGVQGITDSTWFKPAAGIAVVLGALFLGYRMFFATSK